MGTRTFFDNPTSPTMGEIIYFFQAKFPELANDMKNSNHAHEDKTPNLYHMEDSVWSHTMMVCQEARNDHKIVKLSALLHDVGKPEAREEIEANQPKPIHNGEERSGEKETSTKKVLFRGHEGISFWKSIDVLYSLKSEGVINEDEMNETLVIISLHGILYNRIKDGAEFEPEKITHIFKTREGYERFIKHTKNDALGRFRKPSASSNGDFGESLRESIYTPSVFENNKKVITPKMPNELIVMVGLPASGKSTHTKKECFLKHEIISRDEIVVEFGGNIGLSTYSDIFKSLTKEDHLEIDEILFKKFTEAKKLKKDIIIDMTNMSRKSRNKWISGIKGYNKKAVVFLSGESILNARNMLRITEGKHINRLVYENMKKAFLAPTLHEFDEVEFIHID